MHKNAMISDVFWLFTAGSMAMFVISERALRACQQLLERAVVSMFYMVAIGCRSYRATISRCRGALLWM
jgi:hypothetical protein